jgi:outer membrane protein TolC
MKSHYRLILFVCLQFCTLLSLIAQKTMGQDSLSTEFSVTLPPLGVLIDSAMKNYPMIKYRVQAIDAKEANLKSQQISWVKNFGIQSDVRYGTFDIFSTTTAEGQNPSMNATQNTQLNYGIGAFLKIPIYDIINRKHQVDQAKSELQQAETMADAERAQLRQLVIKQYNEVLLKQKLLEIQSKKLSNARVNMDMVETRFRNGQIPVDEYVRILDIATGTEASYESAKSEYTVSFMILEEIVGFKINTTNKQGQ